MANQSNFFIHSLGSNNHINLNFISTTTHFSQSHFHPPAPPSCHQILTFAASVLVNFLELKYQGKDESPFETHPGTMFLAVGSLIAYDVKSRFKWRVEFGNVCVFGAMMAVFGSLALAALFSVLLPWFLSPVLFLLSAMFSLSQLPFFSEVGESERDEEVLVPTRRGGNFHMWRFLENVLLHDGERYALPL